MALWGLGGSTIIGLMSRHVSASEQGQLHGANNSLQGVSGMVGPVLFTTVFAAFISGGWAERRGWHLPGAPFLLAGVLVLASMVSAWIVVKNSPELPGNPDANLAGVDSAATIAPPTGLSDLSPIDG